MRLKEIIDSVFLDSVQGFEDVEIRDVCCHPSEIKGEGCLFVCMDEYLEYNRWQTWRTHLEALPDLGVAAVALPKPVPGLTVPQLISPQPRRILAHAARMLHGCPDSDLNIFGVTGTNGKTTTVRLISHLLEGTGTSCASVGTLGIHLSGRVDQPGTYTTPLAPAMYANLEMLGAEGAQSVAMEVSSHALALDRVEGIQFDGAVLTNIERDHLDFHGTREAYVEAKLALFRKVRAGGVCVLNRNSPQFEAFAAASSGKVISYGGRGSGAQFELLGASFLPEESILKVRDGAGEVELRTRLVGPFQAENILAAYTLLRSLGIPASTIVESLVTFSPVCGRMEQIPLPNGATGIVDYAHNPDGLKNLLLACREICPSRLHLVVGCGGDRDKGKRPIMGSLAEELADICWITSDNPRTEEPEKIMNDMLEGMKLPGAPYLEPDRALAIQKAYQRTESGDLLVVAGKGHEDYQIIGLEKRPFSDQAILLNLD